MKSLIRQGPNNTLNGSKLSVGLMLILICRLCSRHQLRCSSYRHSSLIQGSVRLMLEEDDKGPAPLIEPAEQEKNIDMTASEKGLTVNVEEMEVMQNRSSI